MNKNDWIPVKERLPEAELVYESSYNNKYESKMFSFRLKGVKYFRHFMLKEYIMIKI